MDFEGNKIDFYLNKTRDTKAAKCLFKKPLRSFHIYKRRVITMDKNSAGLSTVDTRIKKRETYT